MFLKALTLKGFKSFAEPTTLELQPGVTVVVGPNGSGKSNVVDAVAWVLGAQGPRTVRSARMDDVIFAGSSKRPALGRAEVSLTIDNASGLLPVESRPGGLRYECGAGSFALFESSGRPSGEHTQMAWQVDDIESVVAELRNRGVVFEEYDMPGLRTIDGVAEVSGNYPSYGGVGERAAWFHDSEGNLLALGQALGA